MSDYFNDTMPKQKKKLKDMADRLSMMLDEISLLPIGYEREKKLSEYDKLFEEATELKREIEFNSYIGNAFRTMGM